MIKNVIFDLDGTLIDSFGDVKKCLISAYESAGIILTQDIDYSIMGPPLHEMIARLSPSASDDDRGKIRKHFRSKYDESDFTSTRIYPEIKEQLSELKKEGKKMFIATNKVKKATIRILEQNKIMSFFDQILTSDYLDDKFLTKFQQIDMILNGCKLLPQETIMIGDGVQDIFAAKDAGILSMAIFYGYGKRQDLEKCKPNFFIDAPNEIILKIKNYAK